MTATTLDQFLKACGASGAWHLGVEGPDAPGIDIRTFQQPFLIVGRDADVDLRLDHPEVSRRHTYLQLVGGNVFCVDLQSRTGTRWRDGLKPMDWIRPGQAIGVGPYWLWFQGDPARPSTDLVLAGDGAEESLRGVEARLEVTGPGAAKTAWRIRRTIVLLGRSRPCWVRLPDRDISRLHCSLVRTDAGFWVVDLLSRGGIVVNGRSVRWSPLGPDDELEVGPYQVRLRLDTVVEQPAWTLARRPGLTEARGPLALNPERNGPLAARLEVGDPALLPLLQELGQMQQQMAEQFQQALMMMFQLFSGMHQDQMTLIREELGEIRRLAQEQQTLQAELAASRQDPASPAPSVTATARTGPAAPPGPSGAPRPERPASSVAPTAERAPGAPEGDLHSFLNQRLAAIQQEQQSRWQKLIQAVMGRDPAGANP